MNKDFKLDKKIGAKLKAQREIRGITQKQLAAGLELSFQQIQKYESAANRISVSMLVRACAILNISSADFISDIDAAASGRRSVSAPQPCKARLSLMKTLQEIDNPVFAGQLAAIAKTMAENMPAPRRKKKAA